MRKALKSVWWGFTEISSLQTINCLLKPLRPISQQDSWLFALKYRAKCQFFERIYLLGYRDPWWPACSRWFGLFGSQMDSSFACHRHSSGCRCHLNLEHLSYFAERIVPNCAHFKVVYSRCFLAASALYFQDHCLNVFGNYLYRRNFWISIGWTASWFLHFRKQMRTKFSWFALILQPKYKNTFEFSIDTQSTVSFYQRPFLSGSIRTIVTEDTFETFVKVARNSKASSRPRNILRVKARWCWA